MLKLVPISQKAARAWVTEAHRHLSAPRGDVIRVGVERDGVLVGVGMAGRPVARMLDDGRTLEVTRIAVLPNQPHVCSMIYAALTRAARALGWTRVLTYTREDEPGTSLRAAGWRRIGEAGGGEWSRPSRARSAAEQPIRKVRWEAP